MGNDESGRGSPTIVYFINVSNGPRRSPGGVEAKTGGSIEESLPNAYLAFDRMAELYQSELHRYRVAHRHGYQRISTGPRDSNLTR